MSVHLVISLQERNQENKLVERSEHLPGDEPTGGQPGEAVGTKL